MTSFPLLGEPLAVDLANTAVRLRGRDVDLLADDDAVTTWLELHPALDPVSGGELRSLRDAVREVFRAAVDGTPASLAATDAINEAARDCEAVLMSTSDGLKVAWSGGALAVVARSAIEVVAGDNLRGCANHECVLFFAHGDDRRKFCDTKTCANRARQARHRERHAQT